MTRGWVAALAAVLLLSACAGQYELVGPNRTYEIRNEVAVDVKAPWNRAPLDPETWTLDGENLNRLVFFAPLRGGRTMAPRGNAKHDRNPPHFRGIMTEAEIMDMVEASLRLMLGVQNVRTANLRPAAVDGVAGFRFDAEWTDKLSENSDMADGADYKATFQGAVKKRHLYLIGYWGTAIHYYDVGRPAAEAVMQSVRIIHKPGPKAAFDPASVRLILGDDEAPIPDEEEDDEEAPAPANKPTDAPAG